MIDMPVRMNRRHLTREVLAFLMISELAFALVACSSRAGSAGRSITAITGTIAGSVVAGPTCPVEQAENPCPDRPVTNRQVNILTVASAPANATPRPGSVAASTTTDASGDFSVSVPPGRYIVQVVTGPGMLGMRQITPGDVTVAANQTTTVTIDLDTGIR